jgi:hypothetical protein
VNRFISQAWLKPEGQGHHGKHSVCGDREFNDIDCSQLKVTFGRYLDETLGHLMAIWNI